MKTLVIAEHHHTHLNSMTLSAIAAAKQLGHPVDVLVMGYQCEKVAKEVAQCEHVSKVLLVDNEVYKHFLAENVAITLKEMAKDYSHILAPSSTFGKDFMPRLAALLNVSQVSDIIEVLGEDRFKRPIYAGNAIATVKSLDPIKVITVRATAFSSVKSTGNNAPIETLSFNIPAKKTKFVKQELTKSERPELTSAKVIVSGGRGMQNKENFHLIEELADKLGAAIGASRAAVDAGFVPNDYQVGQTGKVVAPELYIAVGISGAIQHIAGMKDSKIIVAINKDPEAPIFKIADYGLVGDLFKILPELMSKL